MKSDWLPMEPVKPVRMEALCASLPWEELAGYLCGAPRESRLLMAGFSGGDPDEG